MFKVLNVVFKSPHYLKRVPNHVNQLVKYRTFLSQAYYCNEVWEQRLKNPLLQKVNLDEFYNELDQKYQSSKTISAVDVDIFVNAVNNDIFTSELLDLIHKLRLSADTCNTLNSTSHAVIRSLIQFNKKEELLSALDDRLNYGIFLDFYTACLLMDTFWKSKDYLAGAQIAVQLMLQEDFSHSLSASLSLIHCYYYLLNPSEWPQPPKPEEPEEEEVKIRINYVRNPYDDNHFDIKDPLKIVGKTIMMITKQQKNTLEKSLHLLGLALFEEHVAVKVLVDGLKKSGEKVYSGPLELVPKENPSKILFDGLATENADVEKLLQEAVKLAERTQAEKDVAFQCENYSRWEQERLDALEKQKERLHIAERLTKIDKFKQEMQEKEMLLWYFENAEKYELQIEEKQELFVDKKEVAKTGSEEYIPPEIVKKQAH